MAFEQLMAESMKKQDKKKDKDPKEKEKEKDSKSQHHSAFGSKSEKPTGATPAQTSTFQAFQDTYAQLKAWSGCHNDYTEPANLEQCLVAEQLPINMLRAH